MDVKQHWTWTWTSNSALLSVPFSRKRDPIRCRKFLLWFHFVDINPFTAPACKFSGLKSAHIHTSEQYNLFDGPAINLPSILCILIEILPRAHAKRQKSLNGSKFGTFLWLFPSDSAASMAVKGLRKENLWNKGDYQHSEKVRTCKRLERTPFLTTPILKQLPSTMQQQTVGE